MVVTKEQALDALDKISAIIDGASVGMIDEELEEFENNFDIIYNFIRNVEEDK